MCIVNWPEHSNNIFPLFCVLLPVIPVLDSVSWRAGSPVVPKKREGRNRMGIGRIIWREGRRKAAITQFV